MGRSEPASQRPTGLPATVLAAALGGIGGFAVVVLGSPGLVLGSLVIALAGVSYFRRGWGSAVAWIAVGAGLVPTIILSPALFNTDPAVHYLGESYVALAAGLLVLLVGLAWAALSMRRR
jgi:hypothetical protein